MGRSAQDRLAELEKQQAPFASQIEQAALFADIAWDERSCARPEKKTRFNGREDWVLKWLLKKLGSKDGIGRECPQSWRLLTLLLGRLPLPTAAKTLNEKNFVVLLRQTLEEAVDRKGKRSQTIELDQDSSETARGSLVKHQVKATRKRKRSGTLIAGAEAEGEQLSETIIAIFETVQLVVASAKRAPGPTVAEDSFASEYMKAAIRTTSEEAARILGAWIFLSQGLEELSLSPFQEIWALHVAEDDEASHIMFSKYCLEPSLALISSMSPWTADLEHLIAQNIVTPGKFSFRMSSKSSLRSLAGNSVRRNPKFAPILFDIAIRCLRPQASGRYGQQDSAWLQEVFSIFRDEINGEDWTTKNMGIYQMLRVADENHVIIELPLLRNITSTCGFSDSGRIDVEIISAVIKLDANVFLVADPEEDLLKRLLNQVTLASIDSGWPSIADKLLNEILTPLMGSFAKARNLTGFIHHWFEQMVSFDNLREKCSEDVMHFSAWEAHALQVKLRDVMEESLNTRQIFEIIDWLEPKSSECESAVLVLTEALIGAINRYETAEELATRLCGLVARVLAAGQLRELISRRYRPRLFRLIPRILEWKSVDQIKSFSLKDEYRLADQAESVIENDLNSLEAVEAFRYICSMTSIQPIDAIEKKSTRVPLSEMMKQIFQVLDGFILQLKLGEGLESDVMGIGPISVVPRLGLLAPEFAKILLLEYPELLKYLAKTAPETLDGFLQRIFWIASASLSHGSDSNSKLWLQKKSNVFRDYWMKLLSKEDVENDRQLMSHLMNTMLNCSTHVDNPIYSSQACNGFAVRSLLLLPIESFSKTNRESILKAWKPHPSESSFDNSLELASHMSNLDPAILSLKMKMISRSMLYESIKIQDLVDLADAITLSSELKVPLAIFSELIRRAITHASESVGQARSDEYVHEGVTALKSWLHTTGKSKSPLGCGMVCLASVFISSLTLKTANAETSDLRMSFQDSLISNITRLLSKPAKLRTKYSERCESLMSSLRAIESLESSPQALRSLEPIVGSSAEQLIDINESLRQKLLDFNELHFSGSLDDPPNSVFDGDVTSSAGRQDIRKKAMAVMGSMDNLRKLEFLALLLDESAVHDSKLNRLLPLKDMIGTCEDAREATETDMPAQSLSSIYSKLAKNLCRVQGVRQFCLFSQSMEFILLSKPRSITQYNVEETLSTVCHICSPAGPSLRPSHARTIYAQICSWLNAILTSHRLKLQGRSHLLIKALEMILRPLFTPLSATFPSRFPPWQPSNSSQSLNSASASSFTRILTLICDPTVSAVRSGTHSALSSAPAEAKRLAGEYMPQVLAVYIKLTLDMGLTMDVEIREKLVPGWEAVLATMTVEGRRALGEQLDVGGRAVLAGLVRDWVRFGKWKGD